MRLAMRRQRNIATVAEDSQFGCTGCAEMVGNMKWVNFGPHAGKLETGHGVN
jgi:hypothetical protein